ncbi:TPA: hypothetical protein TU245_000802 [Streptococcus equi subsp. zooepidemicus]|uniref:HNH endonuclease n=1 Tax=Streptococcus equi TaxID=1336 RepID=UPI001E522571|nr:HNH endonuclease [Streptococcus equi subsp. zooepidemicus]HEL0577967.1 hypothetical protein [Streptococcus equi subsp. zooepidemicus]HEL0794693.1 hypothetical protein [Streptococcus equi subsp. zooepidemicus]
MKSTIIPTSRVTDFYLRFCSNMKTSPIKDKFIGIYPKIINEECRYFYFASMNSIEKYTNSRYLEDNSLKSEDFDKLFERFKKSSSTSDVKKYLLETVSNSKCIYCEKRSGNDSLDHLLPKSKFGYLAVVPTNLISCCSTCNSKKNASTHGFTHPYFEKFNEYNFIKCHLKIDNIKGFKVICVDFSFVPFGQSSYEYGLSRRLNELFDILDLNKRYSDYCIELINECILEWKEDCEAGKEFFLGQLKKVLRSRQKQYSNNSFIIAFYQEFIDNIESEKITINDIKNIS